MKRPNEHCCNWFQGREHGICADFLGIGSGWGQCHQRAAKQIIHHGLDVGSLAGSADGHRLASSSWFHLQISNPVDGTAIWETDNVAPIVSLTTLPSSGIFVAGTDAGDVTLHDFSTARRLEMIRLSVPTFQSRIHPSASPLAAATTRHVFGTSDRF
jgi:hypothetical protein